MAEPTKATPPTPSPAEVLRKLAEQVEVLKGSPERISIMAGSPTNYVARIYMTPGDEYEAFQVTL